MAERKTDPAKLAGAELERWYRRTPDEIEHERRREDQRLYDEFFGETASPRDPGSARAGERNLVWSEDRPNRWRATGQAHVASGSRRNDLPESRGASWQEAQLAQPRARTPPSPLRPPRPRTKPEPQLRGPAKSAPGPVGSFFDRAGVIPNPNLGPAYYSDLPRPLNVVEPEPNGWFRLHDGSIVQAGELERLYTEQQLRMQGKDEVEPAAQVRSMDRLKDGFIPRADQLAKEGRELDATCLQHGGWEHDRGYPHYSPRTQRYETQITRAPGLDYVVRTPDGRVVKFDGCAVWDPRRQLLEAKGQGLADLADDAPRYGFVSPVARAVKQVERQLKAAEGHPVDWHAAEGRFHHLLRRALGPPPAPSPTFDLQHTPAR